MTNRVPTTTIQIGNIQYVVRLDKRTGFNSRESYEAEIARIVKMAKEAGHKVAITRAE